MFPIPSMGLFLTIFLYLPLFFWLYLATQNLLRKLHNLPPGPFLAFPVIGNIYLLKKPMQQTFHRLSNEYGPVFSLQLGSRLTVIVSSPSAAAECFSKTNDPILANRPRFLFGKYLGYNFRSGGWSPYGDHWRNVRRILSMELLSAQRIQSLSQIRLDEVRILIRHLFEVSSETPGCVIEMRSLIFELSFNVLTRIIFGKRYYGKSEAMINSGEAKQFQDIFSDLNQLVSDTTAHDFIPSLRWFANTEKKYKAVQEKLDKFFQDMVDGIRGRSGSILEAKAKTIIEVLLSLQETDPEYYTDDIVKALSVPLLQGGSDTSVSTTEWAMTLLLNNPQVLKKVRTEIDEDVGHRLIDDSDLSKLPYLNCVIKEALRLNPVSPLLLPRESSRDCTIGGFHIPRGTIVYVNAWAVQNDPQVWDDPGMFKPERFMSEKCKMMKEEFKHLSFGAGRRKCPAEPLAMRMIGLALGSLIQCFDWQIVSDDLEDFAQNSGILACKAQPLMATCLPRASMVDLLSQI